VAEKLLPNPNQKIFLGICCPKILGLKRSYFFVAVKLKI
jgi:hypothetical protein